jgi:hypothetical protein
MKGHGRVTIVQMLCKNSCKWKLISFETVPGMEGGGNKGEWLRG